MAMQKRNGAIHPDVQQHFLGIVGTLLNPQLLAVVRQRIERAAEAFAQLEHLDPAAAAHAALSLERALSVLHEVAHEWRQSFGWHHTTHLGWPPATDRLDVCLTELIAAARNVVVACEVRRNETMSIPSIWMEIGEIQRSVENRHHASTQSQVADLTLDKCRSVSEVTTKLTKQLASAVFVQGLSADPDEVGVVIEAAAYFALDIAFTGSLLRHVLNETTS